MAVAKEHGRSLSPVFLFGNGAVRPDAAAVDEASRHKLDLLLLEPLLGAQSGGLSTRAQAEAARALQAAAAHNRRLIRELVRVLTRLGDAGIPALPLKGPVLTWLLWSDLRLRHCRDLDILVPQEQVADAVTVLEAISYQGPSPVSVIARELHLEHESENVVLDLHWNIVEGGGAFRFDFSELWSTRCIVRWEDEAIPFLNPEWLFVVTCMYLIKNYPQVELLYLSDLARLVDRTPDLDWNRVATIAARTGTRRICAIGLMLIAELPGAMVPASALQLLATDARAGMVVHRLRKALADPLQSQPATTLRQIRITLGHAQFRERLRDKLQVYAGAVALLLNPPRGYARQSWTQRSLRRLRTVRDGIVASLATCAREWRRPSAASVRPAPGASFHPLDDAGVLSSTATGELYSLTPSAAFLWCCLEEGMSIRDATRRYARASGRPLAEALAETKGIIRVWRDMGLLGPAPAVPALPVAKVATPDTIRPTSILEGLPVRRRYRLLDTVFDIGFASTELLEVVDQPLHHLTTTGPPVVPVAVLDTPEGFIVVIDGREEDRCRDPGAVAPMVKSALNAAAVNRHDFALYLHAAMLRLGDRALLLPAAPHSGKTCLSAALARAGFTYQTDEITLLEGRTFAARGVRVALTVKNSAWRLLEPLYPDLASLPAHRRVDGKIVKYLPPPGAMGPSAPDDAIWARWIIFPRYSSDSPNELAPLPRVEAMRGLMEECLAFRLNLEAGQVQRMIDWIAGTECYTLTFNDLGSAVRLIEEACGGSVALSGTS